MIGVRKYFKLDQALEYRSRVAPFPFIIAHECWEPFFDENGVQQYREREYYAFEDVETFLDRRHHYPHSHEVVANRGAHAQGRLVFDFDVEEKYWVNPDTKIRTFVGPSFQADVEETIKKTLRRYYRDVDISRLRFVWLSSANPKKYSRHLIVNGVYFCNNWVAQLQTFYTLFRLTAYRDSTFTYIPHDKLVDTQVARNKATMRTLHSSKMNRPSQPSSPPKPAGKALTVECVSMAVEVDEGEEVDEEEEKKKVRKIWIVKRGKEAEEDVTFYDTLICLYRQVDARKEQYVKDSQLLIDKVLALRPVDDVEDGILKNIPQLKLALEAKLYDHVDQELTEECLEYLEKLGDQYTVRECKEGMITLTRAEPGRCPISGKEHHSDGGYVTVSADGWVRFHCFRGCQDQHKKAYKVLGKKETAQSKEEVVKEIVNKPRIRHDEHLTKLLMERMLELDIQ